MTGGDTLSIALAPRHDQPRLLHVKIAELRRAREGCLDAIVTR